jgi:outer membrane receptor protein involved in Fe transport
MDEVRHLTVRWGLVWLLGLLGAMAVPHITTAQSTHSLTGRVTDAQSGEGLAYATLSLPGLQLGGYTDDEGRFTLERVPQGSHTLVVNYVGYLADTLLVEVPTKKPLSIGLSSESIQLGEVEISSADLNRLRSTDMGTATLTVEEIETLPTLFGEVDIMRTFQLLPGVTSSGDGNSSIFVRGGSYSQNLIRMDGATVYNPSHLLGIFSVFNSSAIADAQLLKGNFPAQYGGRLASVLDVTSRDGDRSRFGISGGVGLLASRLTIEGPIVPDRGSFLVTGRRTYMDQYLRFSPDRSQRERRIYFYDLNARASYDLSPKDRLFVSVYHGRDEFKFRKSFNTNWGNTAATLQYQHLFSEKLILDMRGTYSNFDYAFITDDGFNNWTYSSGIRDFGGQAGLAFSPSSSVQLRAGGELYYHFFQNGNVTPGDQSNAIPFDFPQRRAVSGAAYGQADFDLGPRWRFQVGLRYNRFTQIGKDTIYGFEDPNSPVPTDTVFYNHFEPIVTYGGFDPRLGIRYQLNDQSSLKASYARTRQFLHVASNATASLPVDVWVPANQMVPPQWADQVSAGYFRFINNMRWETSAEVYYKRMYNQAELRDNAEIFTNKFMDRELLFGDGWAYGAEFFLKRRKGPITGWVSYTLAWSTRQFQEINQGRVFYAPNDRRHNLAIVLNHEFSKRVSVSTSWTYTTGQWVTIPAGKLILDGQVVGVYPERYNYRMEDYHRLDLSLTLHSRERTRWHGSWNFSIYNAYNRKNPWAFDIDTSEDGEYQETNKIYLFGIVPSVTYLFEFK